MPDTAAVNTLLYFTGMNPKKVNGVRVYHTTYDDGFDNRSEHSSWSGSSWGSGVKREIYLLETRGTYWDGYSGKSSRSGRASRASGHGKRDPWAGKGRGRPAQVDDDDEDDDGSVHGGFRGPPPPMGGPPPPMGPFPPRPPPGAFQPGFGRPPSGFQPGFAGGPPPPPTGFQGGPPPGFPGGGFPPRATPIPVQPGGGGAPGHFVRDPNGIQVFDAN